MRSKFISAAACCAGALGAVVAQAATAATDATPPPRAFAAPDVAGAAGGGAAGHMLQTLLALIVVLALVFALAWFFRRMRTVSGASAAAIEVLSQASLGTKERAVLLKVGEARVLVGVAVGSVRTLHVLSAAEAASLSAPAPDAGVSSAGAVAPSFGELLRRGLGAK